MVNQPLRILESVRIVNKPVRIRERIFSSICATSFFIINNKNCHKTIKTRGATVQLGRILLQMVVGRGDEWWNGKRGKGMGSTKATAAPKFGMDGFLLFFVLWCGGVFCCCGEGGFLKKNSIARVVEGGFWLHRGLHRDDSDRARIRPGYF